MNKPLPSAFHPELTSDRLQEVASWLLGEWYATEDDLVRDTDNGYTRGCTVFMRQRNRILKEAASGKQPWLGVLNAQNDLVFTIGGVPCRYSNDDAENPTKSAVTTVNRFQESFVDFEDDTRPARYCFVLDRGPAGAEAPHVELLGFTVASNLACRWVSSDVRVFRVEGQEQLVQPVEVSKPIVAPKRRDAGDAATEAA